MHLAQCVLEDVRTNGNRVRFFFWFVFALFLCSGVNMSSNGSLISSSNSNSIISNNNNNNNSLANNNNLSDSTEALCALGGGEQPDADYIKMFVGQVPKSMDEDQLRKMFEEYGRVHSINVLRDKVTGVSKGKCCARAHANETPRRQRVWRRLVLGVKTARGCSCTCARTLRVSHPHCQSQPRARAPPSGKCHL